MFDAFLGSVITVAQWNWLMDIPKVCTPDALFRLICPAGEFLRRYGT
jgi:hypothetical protein